MPGADYEGILSELSKYGASLILATQSLARLEALDRDQGRSLRATVFANLDGLFAFHTSAEDARTWCRSSARRSTSTTWSSSASTSATPSSRPAANACRRSRSRSIRRRRAIRSSAISSSSCRRLGYGRDRKAVDEDLRSALARIELLQGGTRRRRQRPSKTAQGTGTPSKQPNETTSTTKRVRSKKSTKPPKPGEALQGTLIDAMHDGKSADEELVARDEPIPAPIPDKSEGDEP